MTIYSGAAPTHMPVVPPVWIQSLAIKDDLVEQRKLALKILFKGYDIYRRFLETGHHPLITPQLAEFALRHTDHTTLRTTRNEPADWMRRIAWEAANPYPMRSVCTWFDGADSPHTDKLTPLLGALRDHPDVGITCVLGYPHGFESPEQARKEIAKFVEATRHVPNKKEIDIVINYDAWMTGDHATVRNTLQAIGKTAREHDLAWKAIIKVTAHGHSSNQAFPADPFRSVYDATMEALKAGADCVKTSTGVAAAPPYNYLVTQDTGIMERYLPMLLALRDFNKANNASRWPKFSGGNNNECDAAIAILATRALCGAEVVKKMAFGTSYRFRRRLLESIAEQTGNACPFDIKCLEPYDVDTATLPPHRTGIAPAHGASARKTPSPI